MANPPTIPQVYKDPTADLDYGFDLAAFQSPPFKSWLTPGETIVDLKVTADPGLTVNSASILPNADQFPASLLVAWLSGGVVGASYNVQFLFTTSAGRVDARSILVIVVAR